MNVIGNIALDGPYICEMYCLAPAPLVIFFHTISSNIVSFTTYLLNFYYYVIMSHRHFWLPAPPILASRPLPLFSHPCVLVNSALFPPPPVHLALFLVSAPNVGDFKSSN